LAPSNQKTVSRRGREERIAMLRTRTLCKDEWSHRGETQLIAGGGRGGVCVGVDKTKMGGKNASAVQRFTGEGTRNGKTRKNSTTGGRPANFPLCSRRGELTCKLAPNPAPDRGGIKRILPAVVGERGGGGKRRYLREAR